jgi:hypothetical protein
MGELDRFRFYDHMKAYLASPDILRFDEKNRRKHCAFNICGAVMTTNHKVDGIYLSSTTGVALWRGATELRLTLRSLTGTRFGADTNAEIPAM